MKLTRGIRIIIVVDLHPANINDENSLLLLGIIARSFLKRGVAIIPIQVVLFAVLCVLGKGLGMILPRSLEVKNRRSQEA
jgi:hypothetical protein